MVYMSSSRCQNYFFTLCPTSRSALQIGECANGSYQTLGIDIDVVWSVAVRRLSLEHFLGNHSHENPVEYQHEKRKAFEMSNAAMRLPHASAIHGEVTENSSLLANRRKADRWISPSSGRGHETGLTFGFYLRVGELSGCSASDPLRLSMDRWLSPFQQSEWLKSWQDTVGSKDGVQPVTAVITFGRRAIAVLPLAIRRSQCLSILSWHADAQSDYGAPIISMAYLEEFCALNFNEILTQISRQIGTIDLIYLTKQPATIAGKPNPLHLRSSYQYHVSAHALNFKQGESWEQFLTRTRSPSTLRQLRKKLRQLREFGAVNFRIATTADDARGIAEHCLAAKSRQLAKLGHHDPFASPAARQFLIDYFAMGAGRSTWAAALTLDGELLATSVGLIGSDGWLLYQMAMDCDYLSHCSPGSQLFSRIMQHCVEQGIGRLDLALGDEQYKLEWCDEHQSLLTSVLPLTLKGRLAATILKVRARAMRYIASNPKLYEHGKDFKQRLRLLHIPV